MHVCDLQTGSAMLRKAVAQLKEKWDATSEQWNDAPRRAFARDRLDPLLPEINLLLSAVQRFSEVLTEAERECRDEGEVVDPLGESS